MSSSGRDAGDFPLIRTKLNMPRVTGELIDRPRLITRLDQGQARKLTLISAPAGYGKTTLAVTWLRGTARPAAWLSLSEADNDLALFLSYLVASLRTQFPDACPETRSFALATSLPPVTKIASTFINEISDLPEDGSGSGFYLALDDFHRLTNQEIHNLLAQLIEHQPERLHLVLISRHDPFQLPLGQLRARREIVELRRADLRLNLVETRVFMKQALGAELSQADLTTLYEWNEGWLAGLQLALSTLSDFDDPTTFIQAIKRSERYVTDYLIDEVLSQQPAAVREFLLKTSVLGRFCGPLCQTILGSGAGRGQPGKDEERSPTPSLSSGRGILERLERTNLFLVPLDEQHEWYRYHHLFQDLLVSKLRAEYPAGEINGLHRLARQWFADHGYVEEAIQHAMLADDVKAAIKLVEDNSQNLLNEADRYTLERWLSLLPAEEVWQSPVLLLAQAWLLYRQWRLTALERVLARVELLLKSRAGAQTSNGEQGITGQIKTLRCTTVYLLHSDFRRAVDLGQEALRQLPASALGARAVALAFSTFGHQALGQRDRAVHLLKEATEDPTPFGPAKTQAFIGLGLCHLQAADLSQMEQVSSQFLIFAGQVNQPNAILGANYVAGCLSYEWNDLAAAKSHFTRVFEQRYSSNFMGAFNSMLGLIRICQERDQWEQAQEMISNLREDTQRVGSTDLLPLLEAVQAEQWLSHGNVTAAMRWARSFQSEPIADNIFKLELPILIQARILVRHGGVSEVQAITRQVQDKLAVLEAHHFTGRVIQSLAHLALMHDRLGRTAEAVRDLRRALNLAEPGGLIRSFVDCGSALVPLLHQLQHQGQFPDYLPRLLAAFPADRQPPTALQEPSSTTNPPIEPLTRREREVLQLMRAGLTNQEIADDLVISLFTVKKHSSNIFAKLSVKSRRQAVKQATRLGLLDT